MNLDSYVPSANNPQVNTGEHLCRLSGVALGIIVLPSNNQLQA